MLEKSGAGSVASNKRISMPAQLCKIYNDRAHRNVCSLKENPMKYSVCGWLLAATLLVASGVARSQTAGSSAPGKESVLNAADVGNKLLPEKVFFRGQLAPVQARNTGGVRYADGFLVFAGLVDNSGYSTGLRDKYQAYLITEVALEVGGQALKPGAYGIGFLEGNKFVAMDLGANDVLQAASTKDGDMKRPVPLQFIAASTAGSYRLYHGRDYVEFHRAK
jgi:hypothetical protein